MEHIERIYTTGVHAKFFLGRIHIECNAFFPLRVNTTDIDGEFSIEEDPDVVVAIKCQRFATFVFEIRMELRRKFAIILCENLRKPDTAVDVFDSLQWQEGITAKLIRASTFMSQSQRRFITLVQTRDVFVPPLEDFWTCV